MRYFLVIFIVAAIIGAFLLQVSEARSPVPPPGWCPPGVQRGMFLDFEQTNLLRIFYKILKHIITVNR